MLSPDKMKLKKQEETSTKGVFKLGPLPKGYAHTLGNSLRRVLLSSIMGAAPTRVYIKNASHEFSVIEGVKQDVFTILLAIKQLRIQINTDNFDEVKLTLSKKGVGSAKASDIKTPSNVKIANPDLVLFDITDKSVDMEIEIYAKNGYGYVPAEERRSESDEVGVIFLDSAFSPVKFVNYTVSATRLGKETELDELNLELQTDGTIMPYDAVKKASALLRDFFDVISNGEEVLLEEAEEEVQEVEVVDEKQEKAKEILIDELNLPTRTINALKKHNIKTLKDLSELDEDRLISVRNLGEKSINEIRKLLKKEGLSS